METRETIQTTTPKPSPQQLAVADWVPNGTGNLLVEAVAGSGKTATLIGILPRTKGEVGFCAYNRRIADEISSRTKSAKVGDRVKTDTIHSFGYAALRAAFPRVQLEKYSKLKKIAEEKIENKYVRTFAIQCVSMAKQIGIGILSDIDDYANWKDMIYHHSLDESLPKFIELTDGIKACRILLKESNRQIPKVIDFDDMVYAPVFLKLKIKQYDWVLLDEAQDTNPVRRKFVAMMMAPGGRLIAVGDSHQAINGWTGADHNAMDMIAKEFNTTSLPLSTTYRCPKLIVKEARRWVNHIDAHETAPEGKVDTLELFQLEESHEFDPGDAILCRVTKPLVELAFKLIRRGVPCKVEGRAIGDNLIKLVKRFEVSTVGDLYDKVNAWKGRAMAKALADYRGDKCQEIEDQADTLEILLDQCSPSDSIQDLFDKIKSLFGDHQGNKQSILTLSTIHRSKGLEWNRVYALGMEKYSPSKWAKKDWELIQENNLRYVQVTRAKRHLTLVNVPDSRHGKNFRKTKLL